MTSSIERRVVKGVVCGLALAGLTVAAQAADLDQVLKAPALKNPIPDSLTWNGITLYGSIDLGYAYSNNSAPIGNYFGGVNANVFAAPTGRGPISTINTQGYTYVGLKIEENLAYGWQAIGRIETSFSPLTGQLSDGCKTLLDNNGKPDSQQTTSGDSSKCGGINGQAWAGVRNPTYGQLQVGRNNTLAADSIWGFDPVVIADFSGLLWSPGFTAGAGATEAARWNNSAKYVYTNELVHAGLMFGQGQSQGTSLHGDAYAGNFGVTWQGFAFDAVYTVERNVVRAGLFGVGGCGVAGTPSCSTLSVSGQNTEQWALMGRYTYDFTGGAKDAPANRLSFYAGYDHVQYSNPSSPLVVGDTTVGGYIFGAVNNTAYSYGHKNVGFAWIGAKYETGPWIISTGYYRAMQDYFQSNATARPCSSNAHSYCSGVWQTASLSAVYRYDKHVDVYAGVVWSDLAGGFSAGYANTSTTTFLTGLILKF
ncbi:porin [Bradyrhizobium sp. 33ap4]|uniref:porin n=1 Tax=Bradyrhizobium sp. 33ap4 TaxID=3061630 RepID=UPI00292D559A|nr:porin [Bradyrhizobium sp. 33ap4]